MKENKEQNDVLLLLERKFPTIYEVHRNKINRADNLILSTTDKHFAERLVMAYNSFLPSGDWHSRCPDCNNKMTKVREGKYQCDTINCINS